LRFLERFFLPAAAAIFVLACSVSLWRYFDGAPRPIRLSGSPEPELAYRVNLNAAGAARLELLPGIGPVTARAIVEYRSVHGPFAQFSDLKRVPGMGAGKIEKIRPYVALRNED